MKKRKSAWWTVLWVVLGTILLTTIIAVGVKIGNSGIKQSIQDWKDGINDVIHKSDEPTSSTTPTTDPSTPTQAIQFESNELLTFVA